MTNFMRGPDFIDRPRDPEIYTSTVDYTGSSDQ